MTVKVTAWDAMQASIFTNTNRCLRSRSNSADGALVATHARSALTQQQPPPPRRREIAVHELPWNLGVDVAEAAICSCSCTSGQPCDRIASRLASPAAFDVCPRKRPTHLELDGSATMNARAYCRMCSPPAICSALAYPCTANKLYLLVSWDARPNRQSATAAAILP
jgi:hypothetical protein